MIAMANIVKIYADSDSANKVDMIFKHYPNFIGIGAGLGVWGVINLMEGYGNDNPGANAHVR